MSAAADPAMNAQRALCVAASSRPGWTVGGRRHRTSSLPHDGRRGAKGEASRPSHGCGKPIRDFLISDISLTAPSVSIGPFTNRNRGVRRAERVCVSGSAADSGASRTYSESCEALVNST